MYCFFRRTNGLVVKDLEVSHSGSDDFGSIPDYL